MEIDWSTVFQYLLSGKKELTFAYLEWISRWHLYLFIFFIIPFEVSKRLSTSVLYGQEGLLGSWVYRGAQEIVLAFNRFIVH